MIVVKFGGHAMKDDNGLFAKAIQRAIREGEQVVVVHGGGPQIDLALKEAGITAQFNGGFRITTPEVFEVVNRVLAGEIGPALARSLSREGMPTESMSGYGDHILTATKLEKLVNGESVDLGYVGRVTKVDIEPIKEALNLGKVVVLSPVAQSEDRSHGFNVNADLAAAAIAGALGASQLIVMTDVAGIYENWPDRSSLITAISADELEAKKVTFAEGMAPKVQACLDAIHAGAGAVRIIDGTDPLSFEKALYGKGGTLVTA